MKEKEKLRDEYVNEVLKKKVCVGWFSMDDLAKEFNKKYPGDLDMAGTKGCFRGAIITLKMWGLLLEKDGKYIFTINHNSQ